MSESVDKPGRTGAATAPRGIALALLAAALFGLSTPLAKGLLDSTAPQLLAGLLYAGSGLGLGLVWLVRRQRPAKRSEASLSRSDLPWLSGAIVAGGICGPVLLLVGLARTPASTASLLLNFEGVLTALIAWVVFHENVDRRVATGMLAIVVGGLALSWEGHAAIYGLTGSLAIVGACACWALDNNLTQKVSAADPVQIAMLKGLSAGVINTGLALWLGATLPPASELGAALCLGFVCYGLSLVSFVVALRRLGTARTGAYFSTAPFIGAAISFLIWPDAITVAFAAGGLCMAVGVWLHLTERHTHEHAHASLDHAHAHAHDDHHQHPHAPDDPSGEPHSHSHRHAPMTHGHTHYPDIHHRHAHE